MKRAAKPSLEVRQLMGDTIKPQSPGWREEWLLCLFQHHHSTMLLPAPKNHSNKAEQGRGDPHLCRCPQPLGEVMSPLVALE